jgi:tetratricopeptide (TPR) repeat protein
MRRFPFKEPFLLLMSLLNIGGLSAQVNSQQEARAIASKGYPAEALAMIDEVIKSDSTQARYYVDKASYLFVMDRYVEALQAVNGAVSRMPDSVALHNTRGNVLQAMRNFKDALDAYNTAYEKATDSKTKAKFIMNRGGVKFNTRDFEGSYADLKIALALDPDNIDVLNNLAATSDEVNRGGEGIKYLEKVIAIDPTYVPGYVNLGFKYQGLNQHQKALTYFDKAVELGPREALAYSNRSFSRLKTKDYEGALSDVNYSIKLMPTNSWAFKIRAMIKIQQKQNKEACEDLNKAISLGYTEQYGDEVQQLMKKYCKK